MAVKGEAEGERIRPFPLTDEIGLELNFIETNSRRHKYLPPSFFPSLPLFLSPSQFPSILLSHSLVSVEQKRDISTQLKTRQEETQQGAVTLLHNKNKLCLSLCHDASKH